MAYELSKSYQVEIPCDVREYMGLKESDLVAWICVDKEARLVRVPTVEEMKGTMKGFDAADIRDESNRI